MLTDMHELGKPIPRRISGRFVAIEFSLHHPAQALKTALKLGLDSIEQYKLSDAPVKVRARVKKMNVVHTLSAISWLLALWFR